MNQILAGACAALLIISLALGWVALDQRAEAESLKQVIETMKDTYTKIQEDNTKVEVKTETIAKELEHEVKAAIPTVRGYAAGLRLRQQPDASSCPAPESTSPTGESDQAAAYDLPTAPELQADCAETTVMVLGWQAFYTSLVKTWNQPAGIMSPEPNGGDPAK